MLKSAMIRARIEPALKRRAETIFNTIGLSPTDAITLFYQQVNLRRGLPFAVVIPNELTRATMKATDEGRSLVRATDAEDMFKKLGL